MMSDKQRLLRNIHALDFSIKELELYLDVHPKNGKALAVIKELRKKRDMMVGVYEKRYGKYIVTSCDAPADNRWEWVDSPWPWELKEDEM